MKNTYFTYAFLFCLLQNIVISPEIKNNADLVAFFRCHSINGNIQFPSSLANVPQMCIYCAGTKTLTDIDTSTNRGSFTVPKESGQYIFPLLITNTESIEYKKIDSLDDSNTIDHLEISKGQKYKLFYAQLSECKKGEKSTDSPSFEWVIEEKLLPESGRIPDDAVIICCNPEFVESIEGAHYRDLPTVKIRSDLIQFVGSETKIHDQFNELILATIDFNTLHTKTRQQQCIKITHNKVLIAPSIT